MLKKRGIFVSSFILFLGSMLPQYMAFLAWLSSATLKNFRLRKRPQIEDDFKNEDNLKNEDDLKNEDNLKN